MKLFFPAALLSQPQFHTFASVEGAKVGPFEPAVAKVLLCRLEAPLADAQLVCLAGGEGRGAGDLPLCCQEPPGGGCPRPPGPAAWQATHGEWVPQGRPLYRSMCFLYRKRGPCPGSWGGRMWGRGPPAGIGASPCAPSAPRRPSSCGCAFCTGSPWTASTSSPSSMTTTEEEQQQ